LQKCDINADGAVTIDEWTSMFHNSYKENGANIAWEMIEWYGMLADVLEQEAAEKASNKP